MWRPWFEPSVLVQLDGFPPEGFELLTELMTDLCMDPYDRLHSVPVKDRADDRMAELGDFGFIQFRISRGEGLLSVYRLVWTG